MSKKILLIDKYISQRVHQLRIDHNKKVRDFANLLNVEDSFIRKVESFKNKYNIYHLFLISNYLEIDIQDFFPKEKDFKNLSSFKNYSSIEELLNNLVDDISQRKK